MRSTHFTHQYPRRPGATNRSGYPWPADRGAPPTRVASKSRLISLAGSRITTDEFFGTRSRFYGGQLGVDSRFFLNAFIVDLTPDFWIRHIAESGKVDLRNELATRTRENHDLVRSILCNPVKGVNNLRVMERRESTRSAVAVEFDNQHTVVISRQFEAAISAEVVLVKLHSVLPSSFRS